MIRFYRASGGVIAGICAGLGRSFEVNPNVIRLAWLISVFCFGFGVLLYLVSWWLLPYVTELDKANDPKFLGVCRDIALRTGIETSLVRLAAVFIILSTVFTGLLVYVILRFVLTKPEAEKIENTQTKY